MFGVEAKQDSWDELVDLLLSEQDGPVVVLRAYLDASEREDTGLFSVAGYLFDSAQARKFRREWMDTFGARTFSWADLVADSARMDKREHERLIKAGVALVRERSIAASIVSCWTQDVQNFSPTWIRGFGHAYSICCHICMSSIGWWAKDNNYQGGIAYVLEAGDEYHSEADDLLSNAAKVPAIADLYQWKSHGFVPKDPGSPFHAPDLLAWEWGKFMTETALLEKRKMRLSMVHLLLDRLPAYKFHHLGGEPLLKFFNQIHDLGVQQLQEERDASSNASLMDVSDAVQSSESTTPVEDPD